MFINVFEIAKKKDENEGVGNPCSETTRGIAKESIWLRS
jgi:hypothetical protein